MVVLALILVCWLAAMFMCIAICAAVKRADTEIALERGLTGTGEFSRPGSRRPPAAIR